VKHKLRPLSEQVMVITGASSGIGLVAARQAAARGVAVVLAARNTEALEALAAEITDAGGRALAVTTDVGRAEDVERLAAAAVAEFGRFDTWVNNAGVSIYGMGTVPRRDCRGVTSVRRRTLQGARRRGRYASLT
jgi:NADP-dependent 3-hydroxy acid dehydrogenase YdfG